jgi:hypothetical protein
MLHYSVMHRLREELAIYGKRASGGNSRQVGTRKQQASQRPQLRLQQPVRVGELYRFE